MHPGIAEHAVSQSSALVLGHCPPAVEFRVGYPVGDAEGTPVGAFVGTSVGAALGRCEKLMRFSGARRRAECIKLKKRGAFVCVVVGSEAVEANLQPDQVGAPGSSEVVGDSVGAGLANCSWGTMV